MVLGVLPSPATRGLADLKTAPLRRGAADPVGDESWLGSLNRGPLPPSATIQRWRVEPSVSPLVPVPSEHHTRCVSSDASSTYPEWAVTRLDAAGGSDMSSAPRSRAARRAPACFGGGRQPRALPQVHERRQFSPRSTSGPAALPRRERPARDRRPPRARGRRGRRPRARRGRRVRPRTAASR